VDSAAALTVVAAADSVEVVVGSVEDVEEEDLVTAGDLVTEVALVTAVEVVVSRRWRWLQRQPRTTLDHREVEGATGRYLLTELVFT
jgi:hypothetical protein